MIAHRLGQDEDGDPWGLTNRLAEREPNFCAARSIHGEQQRVRVVRCDLEAQMLEYSAFARLNPQLQQ